MPTWAPTTTPTASTRARKPATTSASWKPSASPSPWPPQPDPAISRAEEPASPAAAACLAQVWMIFRSAHRDVGSEQIVTFPDVGLDVQALVQVPVDLDGHEPVGHHVAAGCRKAQTRPCLPLLDRPGDPHGLRADREDLAAQAYVHPQPRVERQALRCPPGHVGLHGNEWIGALAVGSDGQHQRDRKST